MYVRPKRPRLGVESATEGRPHRSQCLPARPRKSVHRPVAGNGDGDSAPLPDGPAGHRRARLRDHRGGVPGVDGARASAGRCRGRPPGPVQGGRGGRLRPLGGMQTRSPQASAGAWAPTTAFLLVDRLGKGIRTAPRDALISLSADRRALGRAFGVHRAMDTAGALLGPLAAFIVLAQIPRGFNAIFVLSSCTAVVGLAILILFVRNPVASDPIVPVRSKTTFRDALALFRVRRYKAIVVGRCGSRPDDGE